VHASQLGAEDKFEQDLPPKTDAELFLDPDNLVRFLTIDAVIFLFDAVIIPEYFITLISIPDGFDQVDSTFISLRVDIVVDHQAIFPYLDNRILEFILQLSQLGLHKSALDVVFVKFHNVFEKTFDFALDETLEDAIVATLFLDYLVLVPFVAGLDLFV
jgi:hypothetical protein